MDAIDRLEHCKVPLQGASIEVEEIRPKYEVMLTYTLSVFLYQHLITNLSGGNSSIL